MASDFQRPDFIPSFDKIELEDLEETVRVVALGACGLNKTLSQSRCIYDYWLTEDPAIASATFIADTGNIIINETRGMESINCPSLM